MKPIIQAALLSAFFTSSTLLAAGANRPEPPRVERETLEQSKPGQQPVRIQDAKRYAAQECIQWIAHPLVYQNCRIQAIRTFTGAAK